MLCHTEQLPQPADGMIFYDLMIIRWIFNLTKSNVYCKLVLRYDSLIIKICILNYSSHCQCRIHHWLSLTIWVTVQAQYQLIWNIPTSKLLCVESWWLQKEVCHIIRQRGDSKPINLLMLAFKRLVHNHQFHCTRYSQNIHRGWFVHWNIKAMCVLIN